MFAHGRAAAKMQAETVSLNILNTKRQRYKLATAHTLVKDLKWILLYLKVLGLLPIFKITHTYQMAMPKNRSCAALYTHATHVLGFLLIISDIYIVCSPTAISVIFIYGEMDNATTAFQIMLSITCYAIVLWKSFNKVQFMAIINQLLSVDQELQLHPRAPAALANKCDFYKGYLLLLLAHTSTFWTMKWMNSQLCNSSMICVCLFFIYIHMHAIINAYVIFVAILLHLLTVRFRYLNSFIQIYAAKRDAVDFAGVSTQCSGSTWTGCERERTAEEVDFGVFSQDMIFFYRLHNHLLLIFETLNNYVHIALLVFIGYFLYGSTMAVYYFYFAAILRDDIQLKTVTWCAIFLCLHVPTAAVLMRKSDAAAKEANATSCILARIYGRGLERQKLIDKFLTKSIKQNIQFTAYGFFVINKSTLFKICSAITTYLVILIQFRQLEDSRAQHPKHRTTDEL